MIALPTSLICWTMIPFVKPFADFKASRAVAAEHLQLRGGGAVALLTLKTLLFFYLKLLAIRFLQPNVQNYNLTYNAPKVPVGGED